MWRPSNEGGVVFNSGDGDADEDVMPTHELPDDRADARRFASLLVVHAQTDSEWVAHALEATMAEARRRGWDDIRLALLHALIVYSWKNTVGGTSQLIDELEREADRIGSGALVAIAMVDRIRYLRAINGHAPFELYATARVRLMDGSGSIVDRFTGSVNLAFELDVIGLSEMADEVIGEAERLLDEMDDSTQSGNAIAHNQAQRLLRRSIADVIEGHPTAAVAHLERSLEYRTRIGAGLPDAWLARLEVLRRTCEALVYDEDVPADEAATLADQVDDVHEEHRRMLLLARPLRDQETVPSASDLDGFQFGQTAWFLRARSLRRAGVGGDELVEALEGFNRALLASSSRSRSELEAGLAAMVDAQTLARERGELAELVVTDPLTRLGNRRAWQNALERLDGQAATGVIIDLDRFKSVNDSHGHVVGDVVLQRCAELIATVAARSSPEVVARIGGDEFAVLYAGERTDDAYGFVTALHIALASAEWPEELEGTPTLTTGVGTARSSFELVASADASLYGAKRGQRGEYPAATSVIRDAAGHAS